MKELCPAEALHEECGVFGIYDSTGKTNMVSAVYSALYALQHRGQESCGIALNVAENHQHHNAMQLQKLGAAVVVEEKELTGEKLIGIVDKLTKDPAELMLMGAKARALAQPDSLDKICENLDRLMKTTA